jgi:hypothetical protein
MKLALRIWAFLLFDAQNNRFVHRRVHDSQKLGGELQCPIVFAIFFL